MIPRTLTYFIAVAEEKNIGRAAIRLNISQPPLTRQVQKLENELGVSLFTRTPKGVELTEAGELFLVEARNICSVIERATERTQRAGKGKLGRLDVAIFGSGILNDIPKILLTYKNAYPDAKVVLHTMEKAEQIEALRQRRINVGFNRLLTPLPDISFELITTEKLYLAINENHPYARKVVIPAQVLAENPLVLYPTGTRPNYIDKVITICHDLGFSPQVSQKVGDVITAVALVSSGFGVCLVPESAISLKLPGVVYRSVSGLPENATIDLSCIYRANDKSAILQSFLEVCRTYRAAYGKIKPS
ncbi:MAG: LysR family transcriptional regulator [Emcibacter sp.]|nr:LysR family transcriptional regulator [Emcibacter sp.]